jgi:hypothetical protein
VSLSSPQRAALLGLRDLEARDGRDRGWDEAELMLAAKPYPGGTSITSRTLAGLQRRAAVYCGPASSGRFELTEAGRQRIGRGL